MASASPISPDPKPPPSRDAEELLARFREEWKAEVRQRKLAAQAHGGGEASSSSGITQPQQAGSSTSAAAAAHVTRVYEEALTKPGTRRAAGAHPEIVKVELLLHQRNALEVYKQAIDCEQRGDLDEALLLYRKAFRGYDNVDRLYMHLEKVKYDKEQQPQGTSSHTNHGHNTHSRGKSKETTVDSLSKVLEDMAVAPVPGHGTPGPGYVTGKLASMISEWGQDHLGFEPEEGREREPVPLAGIPDEILVHIIERLDLMSLERFAAVNRKTRVLTLDSSIWRSYVQELYQPPQIHPDEDIPTLLTDYLLDYRRMFVEHPRIRLDGVYIAVLHYTRKGLSENAWVNISHLITYHRYLRFFPDGTVLSLLANEEIGPQQVIPILKPSLRMKGFYIGNWRLVGTDVLITDLTDPSPPGPDPPKYTFQMQLELTSRPVGRWNRLNFVTYESVTRDGEATPLVVKHDRPFWFSKVRSYGGL